MMIWLKNLQNFFKIPPIFVVELGIGVGFLTVENLIFRGVI